MTRSSLRRPPGHARRSGGPKRRSARLSPARAAATLVVLFAALAGYGAVSSSAFAFGRLEVEDVGLPVITSQLVHDRLGLIEGTGNIFVLATDPLEATLRELPSVLDAEVTVRLPDTVHVRLVEREPILAWIVGQRRLLVDREGVLFAEEALDQAGPGRKLPAVRDQREASAALAVGGRLDPVDLDAATRLGSLRPADLGSGAARLVLRVSDADGYTVAASPSAWVAVFGFYTPSLRTPELVPGQVRLLRNLLAEIGDGSAKRIVLASDTDGTYVPRATPSPSGEPASTP